MTNKPAPLPPADTCAATCLPACAVRRRGRPSRDAVAMPRDAILQHAFAAFARDGYERVSLRSLGAECAVSDSLLTHHFGSKQQLWREATDAMFGPIYERLLALLDALAQAGDAVVTLQSNLPQAIKLMAANPVAVEFLFREGEGDDERGEYLRETYLRPYLARLDVLFDQAQISGRYRIVSPASRHALVMGLLRSLVIPGALRAELAPHLATTDAMNAYIDDAVAVLYGGLVLPPRDQPVPPRHDRSTGESAARLTAGTSSPPAPAAAGQEPTP
jgi:TetR/AcrR family transcriptional regulator